MVETDFVDDIEGLIYIDVSVYDYLMAVYSIRTFDINATMPIRGR
jgi:hypothetical protein